MATIRIKNLRLRTIIGIQKWERDEKQDVIINIEFDYNSLRAVKSDKITDAIEYKALTKTIITRVESSNFYLIEKLTKTILDIVLKQKGAKRAVVRVDKPFALRFADSVSCELSSEK